MHVPTHIMSGWCIGNLLPINARQRLFCMIAATIADIDGLGMIVSERAYVHYHHIVGHNLLMAVVTSLILAIFSKRWLLGFVSYFALFHLHLVMDSFGSGRDWGIAYWWPFRFGPGYWFMNPYGWAFYSWQNITAALFLLAWTIWIGYAKRRTPLELLMPSLDRQLVRLPPLADHHRKEMICEQCGYDLRTTPQQCPECGMRKCVASQPPPGL